ncbi:MAG: ATP-grasp domain-containing protein [Acidobacteria bacterium]|nr:ATP-grasp domain-containing protein [Acidobacteriota bacterium]
MPRVLLLFPTTTYRAEAFLRAATRLGAEITVATEEDTALTGLNPHRLLTLDFDDPAGAVRRVAGFAREYPIDAVVPVDEQSAVVAAALAAALSLRQNSLQSTLAAGNKYRMREILRRGGIRTPSYQLFSVDDNPEFLAGEVKYPCVVKPLILSGSRGVIRADTEEDFVRAFRRLAAILCAPDVAKCGAAARQILVEDFIAGKEVAAEGLLSGGKLHVLAIFDKPDPLDGPFFEETIYVTPSRLAPTAQAEISSCVAAAAKALGLTEGPLHAELRVSEAGPWIIEVAARSIGGRCSRALRFDGGASLEEVILRHALGMEIQSIQREQEAAGVMMIPIPKGGILKEINGVVEAKNVVGIEEVSITAHKGQELVPLPEGSRYLGFIFARGATSESVEVALRRAHCHLDFVIEAEVTKARWHDVGLVGPPCRM